MKDDRLLRNRRPRGAIARVEANSAFKLCSDVICDKESAAHAATVTRGSALAGAAAALR